MPPPNGLSSPPTPPSLADPANFAQQAAAFVAWMANLVENEWENLDPDVFFAVQSGLDALETGFLMPVGAFGLGTSFDAGNVDDRHTSGFYFGYGGAHASASAGVNPFPSLNGLFGLVVGNHGDGGASEYIWQQAVSFGPSGPFTRTRIKTTDGAGWGAWYGDADEVWTLLWENVVDGAVNSVESPQLEDGWEYKMVGSRVGMDQAGGLGVFVTFNGDVSAASGQAAPFNFCDGNANENEFIVEFGHMRRTNMSGRLIRVWQGPSNTDINATPKELASRSGNMFTVSAIDSGGGSIDKIAVYAGGGAVFDAGRIWLVKRRVSYA